MRASLKCRAAVATNPQKPFFVKELSSEHNHDRGTYKNLTKLQAIKDHASIIGNLFNVKN
jgi:hypothetical protein